MAHLFELKNKMIHLLEETARVDEQMRKVIAHSERLQKNLGSQEFLDAHVRDMHWCDRVKYFESIKDTQDVFMFPYQRKRNDKYKFWDAAKSLIVDVPRADYATISQTYMAKMDEWIKSDELRKEFSGVSKEFVDTIPGNSDPENPYQYAITFRIIMHNKFYVNSIGWDVGRIYTRATWEAEVPREVRLLMAHADGFRDQLYADCKEYIEHQRKKNPAAYSNLDYMIEKHVDGYLNSPVYQSLINEIEMELTKAYCAKNSSDK